MSGAVRLTRHQRIVAAAEDIAWDCHVDRIDPTEHQVVTTVAGKVGDPPLNQHERAVAWQAYREKFADIEMGWGAAQQPAHPIASYYREVIA